MRIAVRFPDFRVVVGNLTERTADGFIDYVLDESRDANGDIQPFRVSELPETETFYCGGEPVDADRCFDLSPSDFPFDIYWPQSIVESCGISCDEETV